MIVRPRQTGQMDPAERSAALEREGRRLIEVVGAYPAMEVPTCPEWSGGDLLGHVATLWEFIRLVVDSEGTEPPDFSLLAPNPEDHDELEEVAVERLSTLVARLAGVDPARPAWWWAGTRTLGFYQRRAHLETLVHRIDAELGAEARTPVDPAAAIDGVDELFSELAAGAPEVPPTGSLHLHQTDGDGEFMLQLADGVVAVSREHAKGDAALRATGEELLMVVWGRKTLDGMELFGDRAVAEQWIALAP